MSCKVDQNFKSFAVYNRWGQRVYETSASDFSWDGRYQGDRLPSGVYVWLLTYELQDYSGVISRVASGDVTILH